MFQGGAPFRKREQASLSAKLFVLTRRSFVNMHRDIGYYWMRLGVYLGIGICLGTILYQVVHSYSSIQVNSRRHDSLGNINNLYVNKIDVFP